MTATQIAINLMPNVSLTPEMSFEARQVLSVVPRALPCEANVVNTRNVLQSAGVYHNNIRSSGTWNVARRSSLGRLERTVNVEIISNKMELWPVYTPR